MTEEERKERLKIVTNYIIKRIKEEDEKLKNIELKKVD